jgi:hypothetical protein
MDAIAFPLNISRGMIRFKSLINGRIFNFWNHGDGTYSLAELESDKPELWVKNVLYQGNDALQVMNEIWKAVNDVQQ